jgi:hypothetical protein
MIRSRFSGRATASIGSTATNPRMNVKDTILILFLESECSLSCSNPRLLSDLVTDLGDKSTGATPAKAESRKQRFTILYGSQPSTVFSRGLSDVLSRFSKNRVPSEVGNLFSSPRALRACTH